MRRSLLIGVLLLVGTASLHSQYYDRPTVEVETRHAKPSSTLGVGAGLDYGGFGMRLTQTFGDDVSVFAGLGYNIVGAGVNFGALGRIPISAKSDLTPMLMYGYNKLTFDPKSAPDENIHYGATFGLGLETYDFFDNHWSFALLFPVEGSTYGHAVSSQGADSPTPLSPLSLPIDLSVGYHF